MSESLYYAVWHERYKIKRLIDLSLNRAMMEVHGVFGGLSRTVWLLDRYADPAEIWNRYDDVAYDMEDE